jgi:hypothetical protein
MRISTAIIIGCFFSHVGAATEPPARPVPGGVVAIWVTGPNIDREGILKMPVVKGGQVVVQWAEVEREKGKYDFAILDTQLADFAKRGLPVSIQLNGNRKPHYLFNEVPYVKETSRDLPAFRQVQNPEGTLMYWHPASERAYVNCLTAFREHLVKSPHRKAIVGLRMNFNPFGTEGVHIFPDSKAKEYADKKRWIVSPGLDKSIPYEGYEPTQSLAYVRRIMAKHIELFGGVVPMFVRCTADPDVLGQAAKHIDSGEFGVFVTGSCSAPFGAKMENVDAGMMKYCRSGKTIGYAESFSDAWGFHGIMDNLVLPPPQEFYWRVLFDLHKGVSYVAVYGKDLNMALTGTYKVSTRTVDGKPVTINYSDRDSGFNYRGEFQETLALADKYAGYHATPERAPGAWIAFRASDQFADARPTKQKLQLADFTGDYTYLVERLPDKSTGESKVGPAAVRYGGFARRVPAGDAVRLKVNGAFLKSLRGPCRLSVTFFDDAADASFTVAAAGKKWTVPMRGEQKWQKVAFDIAATAFAPADDGTHVVIQSAAAPVCLHMLAIERIP